MSNKMPIKKGNKMLRASIEPELMTLVDRLIPLLGKNDWNRSEVTKEALKIWMSSPEIKAIIDKHSLLDGLDIEL